MRGVRSRPRFTKSTAWGWIFDRIGERAIPWSLLFVSGATVLMLFGAHPEWAFAVTAVLVGAGFGACFVVYAAAATHTYGQERFSRVYPLVFLGCALSGLAGPGLGGWLFDWTGSYTSALVIAAVVPVLGAAVFWTMWRTETQDSIEA